MGNTHCSASTSKKQQKDINLIKKSENQVITNISNHSDIKPNDKSKKINENQGNKVNFMPKKQIDLYEIKETMVFQQDYHNSQEILEINYPMVTPQAYISEEIQQKKEEIIMPKPEITGKSFKELFQNDDSLYLPLNKPSIYSESNKKSMKSTPYFDKNHENLAKTQEINELLAYLPNEELYEESIEEKPRKFDIEPIKLQSLHLSDEKTIKEFSLNSDNSQDLSLNNDAEEEEYLKSNEKHQYEESDNNMENNSGEENSSEPQYIYINLFDLLQNEIKTRRNSLSKMVFISKNTI